MLGEELKRLRKERGLVQRQVAAELEVDTAFISKLEANEKTLSRHHLQKLSLLFRISEEKLLTLWLADKMYDLAKDEVVGLKALEAVEEELKKQKGKIK